MVTAWGKARIRHFDTGVVYEVLPNELDWQESIGDERDMGVEISHSAQVDHPKLGLLTWELWEYPPGAENDRETDVGRHTLLENFSLALDGADDTDETRNRVDALVEWFHERYEDPARETPYNGREGGYQYIWGGPYDARSELEAEFSGVESQSVIEAAVEEIESDGIHDWAPGRLHPDQKQREEEYYDGRRPELEDLIGLVRAGIAQNFGTPSELEARASLSERLNEFELELERMRAGIGHNRPPEAIVEYDQLTPTELRRLTDDLATMRKGLERIPPDAGTVGEGGLALKQNWLARKLDKMADGTFEEIGKWVGRAAVGGFLLTASHAWPGLDHAIRVLIDAVFNWLAVVLDIDLG